MNMDLTAARSWFDLDPALVFLNHGSYGALPRPVREAQAALADALESDPIRFMDAVPGRVAEVRAEVAGSLGARGEDLALVENATAGVSTVLRARRWSAGDRVVVTSHGYGAVRRAVEWLARRYGVLVDEVALPLPIGGPDEVIAAMAPRIPGAAMVIVDLITSPSALLLPAAEVVALCRAAGVPVLVDAAHGPGQVALDLEALDADWVVGNLHKWWFAPRGTAVLWAAPRAQAELDPLVLSHGAAAGFPTAFDWTGTRDPTAWLAVPAARLFMDRLGGVARVAAHNVALCAAGTALLAEAWGVAPVAPPSMRAALTTLPTGRPASEAQALHDALLALGVQVPVVPLAGRSWVRVSAQVHNRLEDYAVLADAWPRAVRAVAR